METLKETLSCLRRVDFTQYFRRLKTRLRLAVTLVALLELIRLGEAGVIEGAGGLEIVSGERAKRIRNEERERHKGLGSGYPYAAVLSKDDRQSRALCVR